MAGLTERLSIIIDAAGIGAISEFKKVGHTAQTELSKVDKATKSTRTESGLLGGALDKMGLSSISTSTALKAGLAVGATAAGVALVKMAKDGVGAFVDLTSQARQFQRLTGATAEESSKLAGTMRVLGIDTDVGAKALGIFAKNIENTPAKLSNLGVEIVRNKDGSVNLTASLGSLGDAYKKAGAGAEGTNIALTALGRGGAALIPILGKSRSELDAIGKSLDKKGLIFDQEALNQGKEFQRSMRELGESVQGLEIRLARGLVPALTSLAHGASTVVDNVDKITNPVSKVTHGIGDWTDSLGKHVPLLGDWVRKQEDAKGIGDKLAATEDELAGAFQEAADQAEQNAAALDKLLNAQVSLVDSSLGLQGAQNSLQRAVADLAEKQKDGTTSALDLKEAQLGVEEAASRVAHAVADQKEQQALGNGVMFTAEQKTQAYKDALIAAANQASGPTKAAILDLAQNIKDLPDSKNVAITTSGAERAIAELTGIGRAINAFTSTAGIGITLPTPDGKRAGGGPVDINKSYLVGEDGPELFVPGASGAIVPNGRGSSFSGVSAAGTNVTINVNAGWGADGEDIARVIRKELASLTNRGF